MADVLHAGHVLTNGKLGLIKQRRYLVLDGQALCVCRSEQAISDRRALPLSEVQGVWSEGAKFTVRFSAEASPPNRDRSFSFVCKTPEEANDWASAIESQLGKGPQERKSSARRESRESSARRESRKSSARLSKARLSSNGAAEEEEEEVEVEVEETETEKKVADDEEEEEEEGGKAEGRAPEQDPVDPPQQAAVQTEEEEEEEEARASAGQGPRPVSNRNSRHTSSRKSRPEARKSKSSARVSERKSSVRASERAKARSMSAAASKPRGSTKVKSRSLSAAKAAGGARQKSSRSVRKSRTSSRMSRMSRSTRGGGPRPMIAELDYFRFLGGIVTNESEMLWIAEKPYEYKPLGETTMFFNRFSIEARPVSGRSAARSRAGSSRSARGMSKGGLSRTSSIVEKPTDSAPDDDEEEEEEEEEEDALVPPPPPPPASLTEYVRPSKVRQRISAKHEDIGKMVEKNMLDRSKGKVPIERVLRPPKEESRGRANRGAAQAAPPAKSSKGGLFRLFRGKKARQAQAARAQEAAAAAVAAAAQPDKNALKEKIARQARLAGGGQYMTGAATVGLGEEIAKSKLAQTLAERKAELARKKEAEAKEAAQKAKEAAKLQQPKKKHTLDSFLAESKAAT